MQKKLKCLALGITATLFLSSVPVSASTQPVQSKIKVTINGKTYDIDTIQYNNKTYLNSDALNLFNANAQFDNKTKTIKISDTVATINSIPVSLKSYKAATALQILNYDLNTAGTSILSSTQDNSQIISQLESTALNYLTNREIQISQAKKRVKLDTSDQKAIDTNYKNFLAQYKNTYKAYYDDTLKKVGISESDFNAEVKQVITDNTLVNKLEIALLDGFKSTDIIKAEHILISNQKHSDADAKKLAQDVLAKIKAGGNFEALAKQYSEDPGSATSGGNLGYFTKGMMVQPFETAAFALNVGQVSDLVQSDYGYHIIKLTGKGLPAISKLTTAEKQQIVSLQEFTNYYNKLVFDWKKQSSVNIINSNLDIK